MLAVECCSCEHGNHKYDYAADDKERLEAHEGEEDYICHGLPDSRSSVGEVEVVASGRGIFVDSLGDQQVIRDIKVDDDRRQYVEKSDNELRKVLNAKCKLERRERERERNVVEGALSAGRARGHNETLSRRTDSCRVWGLLEMRDETMRETRQDERVGPAQAIAGGLCDRWSVSASDACNSCGFNHRRGPVMADETVIIRLDD